MSVRDEEVSQVPDQLMEQLLKGYDSLYIEFNALNEQRQQLEKKLDLATQQYSDLAAKYTSSPETDLAQPFLENADGVSVDEQNEKVDWLDRMSKATDTEERTRGFNIRVANDAREKLRNRQQEVSGVRIWAGRSADKRGSTSSKLRHELERDFTVAGTPSKLGCPFAVRTVGSMQHGQRGIPTPRSSNSKASGSFNPVQRRLSGVDPIKGELCGNDAVSPAVSEPSSLPLCPIRFMDQHSPEEVAEYFEKHKHQIPRSHEVCIKRYQGDSESVRHLDAKYGNLVSMIHGLGQKHQPILAEKEVEVGEEGDAGPKKESVSLWANEVSESLQKDAAAVGQGEEKDGRLSHFDRPLKDIRVGESPSRPWGIQVPSKDDAAAQDAREDSAAVSFPQELSGTKMVGNGDGRVENAATGRKCPIDHRMLASQYKPPEPTTGHTRHGPAVINIGKMADGETGASSLVFTGPVFIGYPTEQANQILRGSGVGMR